MNTTSKGFSGSKWTGRSGGRGKAAPATIVPSSGNGEAEASPPTIRIILADSEAIFRVGMSKIFALQEDLSVVAQTETLAQTLSAVATTPSDVILFEAGLSPNPADAISEVGRRAVPGAKLIMVTQRAGEQETVDYLRRGVRGILARAVSPELLVRCVRKVAAGETWLDKQGVNWVIEAYRTQALQGTAPQRQLRLSEKEMMIISGVTQGMKNKDIAREVKTTEQVVKNYLRKIYDKLNVADRLELALYSMHHRLLDGYVFPSSEKAEGADENKLPTSEQATGPQEVSPNTNGGTATAAAAGQHAKQKHA
jgi:DNA-binding NarL/FixJ family response regulator